MRASFVNIRDYWIKNYRRQARPDSQGRARVAGRSIYILPTKQGMAMVVVLVLMLIGSVNYGSNLGYLVTFLLAAVWLSAILHTWRNLLGLCVQPIRVKPVFAGEDATFQILLQNPSRLERYGIVLKGSNSRWDETDITAQHTQPLVVALPTSHRGLLRLDEVSIHSRYPLGLFHAWTYARVNMSCLVYPRPAAAGEPPCSDAYAQNESGDRGLGADDFIGLRSFRDGDSPRHIDWKAHARERGLYSKQFGGERSEVVQLDWDLLTDSDPETRLSQLCRFVLLAESRHQRYGLKLPGFHRQPANDIHHREACLASLAKYGVES